MCSVPYIVLSLHEEPANFYREKRNVIFVTGHLFTFVVVLIEIFGTNISRAK